MYPDRKSAEYWAMSQAAFAAGPSVPVRKTWDKTFLQDKHTWPEAIFAFAIFAGLTIIGLLMGMPVNA
jgi:hypothetical protein